MRTTLLLFYMCAAYGFIGHAQSAVLDQYVQDAIDNSLQMQVVNVSELEQNSRIDQAKNLWMPQVNLNANYLLARGGRLINFPVGDLFNPVYGAINNLSGTDAFPTNLENINTQLTPNNFIDASLSISKPILNSAIKHNIEIQTMLLEMSHVDRKLLRNELAYSVKQAYFNFLKTVYAEDVLAQNRILLEELYAFNEKLIKYDKATSDALTDVTFQITSINEQINSLKEQRGIAKTSFNILLNRNIESDITVDTTFVVEHTLEQSDLSDHFTTSINRRHEFEQISISEAITELNMKRIEAGKKPTLGVQAGVGLQTENFSFSEGPLYTVGLALSWNIFDGGIRKKKIEESELARSKLSISKSILENNIKLQVSQAYFELENLRTRLNTNDASITSALSSYQSTKKRYEYEKALLIEVLTAQNRLASSRLQKVLTILDLHLAQAKMDYVTSKTY